METDGTVTISISRFKELEFIEKGISENSLITKQEVIPYGVYFEYMGFDEGTKEMIIANDRLNKRIIELQKELFDLKYPPKPTKNQWSFWKFLFGGNG